MSSTVGKQNLPVTSSEAINLKGNNFACKTQFEVSNISNISSRVLTIPTHEVDVIILSSSAGAGTFASSSLKYARVTNLDNANFIRLRFSSGSKNQCQFKLDPLRSIVFTNDQYSGSATGSVSFDSFAGFTNLKGEANTADCALEIYVATT